VLKQVRDVGLPLVSVSPVPPGKAEALPFKQEMNDFSNKGGNA
jgi:hypothetical protein